MRFFPGNNNGFTLIEMLIVMGVFTVVIAIAGKSFELVVRQTNIVAKSEESNIEGVVGLEMFRRDLTQAGFGLFTEVENAGLAYTEASSSPGSDYNDTTTYIPRAVVAGNNLTASGVLAGTDYLALKGTTLGHPTSKAAQKWSYMNGFSSTLPKAWGSNDFELNDNIIAVRQMFKNGLVKRILINDPGGATPFSTTYNVAALVSPYIPPSSDIQFYYYGISAGAVPKRPFNRTDYFINRPVNGDVPASCSPAAGILYKNSLNAASGAYTSIPILDCVADMQIVFGWNTSGITNTVDTYTDAVGENPSGPNSPFPVDVSNATYIRQHLKLIKVYILAQDGGYDKDFINTTNNMVVGDVELGEATLTKTVDLTSANLKNYRWKLYRIVVKPNNLN